METLMISTGLNNTQLWARQMTSCVIRALETRNIAGYCIAQRDIAGRNPPVRNSTIGSVGLQEAEVGRAIATAGH